MQLRNASKALTNFDINKITYLVYIGTATMEEAAE